MPVDRELSEVLNGHQDAILEGIRKVAVGFVTAVNGQLVDVQLVTASPLFDEINGTTFEDAPTLGAVPWGTIAAGGFVVWVPPTVGDTCLVVFSDLSCDSWLTSDGNTKVTPGWVGRHTADSPFAIPMVRPTAKNFTTAADSTKMVIGKDGSTAQIKISGSEIDLGNPAIDAVALASKVDIINTAIKTFAKALSTYVVLIQPIADPTGTGSTTMETACTTLEDVIVPTGSTLVKCG